MPLPGSGAISLAQIQTEFGGANPISMSEYYRNGIYTTSNNTGVPTSGTISISQFYGTSAADYIPAAVDWANISSTTADNTGSNVVQNATQTITGIDQTITLTLDTSNGASAVTSGVGFTSSFNVNVYKNNAYLTGIGWNHLTSGASGGTVSRTVDFTVVSGDTIKFEGDILVASDGITQSVGTGSASLTVRNASSGNTVLDTFTVAMGATHL